MSINDPEIERRFVDTAQGQFHVRCSRQVPPASALPLVMLHASPASAQTLDPLLKGIGKYRRCFAPDTMGFGDSAPPPMETPEAADYANWVLQAIDALGLDRFHLYGSHTGAHIAVEAALQQPDRIEKLVLDGMAMFTPEEQSDVLQHYAPAIVPDEIGSQLNWAWHFIRDQAVFFPYFHRTASHLRGADMLPPELLHDLTVDVLKGLTTYHLGYRAAFRHSGRERLPLVKHSVLITAELSDPLHVNAELAASLVSNGKLWLTPAASDVGARAQKIAGIEKFLNSGEPE
jgi:pimeloyl-ACP methyl ester carboxylesterase